MNYLERAAITLSLIEELQKHGSWCGETHIQKATYFLTELKSVPLKFQFTIYKHGPYSFNLHDELAAMFADGLLELTEQQKPYGPTFSSSITGQLLMDKFPKTINNYKESILYVASTFGNKGVSTLERWATALYITKEHRHIPKDKRVEYLVNIKPHIPFEKAQNAFEFVDHLLAT
ncbi:hypothetical protein LLH00_15580 [bacterium]|nr:hypothetical protein [bacterium]